MENEEIAKRASRRITELQFNPVKGNFDAWHLIEVHRRIFQDVSEYNPGKFREPVKSGYDWCKNRSFESIDDNGKVSSLNFYVAYSAMDKKAISSLNEILKKANPDELKKSDTDAFTKAIGELYANLDYIHPFTDGNSRTLREFTKQLARESGFYIDWTLFAKIKNGRSLLYVARDLSVNKIALHKLKDFDLTRYIAFSIDSFEGNKDMPQILEKAIKPFKERN